MNPVNRFQFVEDYIEPVIYHPVTQMAFQLVIEVVKIVAAKMFLEFLGQRFLPARTSKMQQKIFFDTVVAPVVEEIICRGILLRGIHMLEKDWNDKYYIGMLTDEDEAAQQKFRIHLSALIFAAAHVIFIPHKTISSALIQFTWTYLGGVAYGYLSEKYHTLSVSILVHGFNNSLVAAAFMYPLHYSPIFLIALVVNKVGACILAVTTIDEVIAAGVRQAVVYCASLPGRVMNWNIQEAQEEVVI